MYSRSGLCLEHAVLPQLPEGHRHRHEGAGDGRGARAAIGLNDVAIDDHGALAQRVHIHRGAHGAPDQALDLVSAAGGAALGDFARRALGGGARQHGVLRRHPALSLLRRNGGTVSSTVAAHSTCVFPTLMSAEPSAVMASGGDLDRPHLAGFVYPFALLFITR